MYIPKRLKTKRTVDKTSLCKTVILLAHILLVVMAPFLFLMPDTRIPATIMAIAAYVTIISVLCMANVGSHAENPIPRPIMYVVVTAFFLSLVTSPLHAAIAKEPVKADIMKHASGMESVIRMVNENCVTVSMMAAQGLPQAEPSEETFLFEIAEPDPDYHGSVIELTDTQRDETAWLLQNEAGNQGFEGMVLVAQCIHDALEYEGYADIAAVKTGLGYTTNLSTPPSEDAYAAIEYIFDRGNAAVQHKILYFYSHNGQWHETQHFIIEYKAHRFFDKW